jgi:hypothetical protein
LFFFSSYAISLMIHEIDSLTKVENEGPLAIFVSFSCEIIFQSQDHVAHIVRLLQVTLLSFSMLMEYLRSQAVFRQNPERSINLRIYHLIPKLIARTF